MENARPSSSLLSNPLRFSLRLLTSLLFPQDPAAPLTVGQGGARELKTIPRLLRQMGEEGEVVAKDFSCFTIVALFLREIL